MTHWPPQAVLEAFRLTGTPVALPGGQGESVRVGDVVLKPAPEVQETEWLGEVLTALPENPAFRIATPRRTVQGRFVEQGWQACRWLEGRSMPVGHWDQLLGAARQFHAALAGIAPHRSLGLRTHRWALADRVAFGEADFDPLPALRPLADALRPWAGPVTDPPALVHGDLSGNVLLSEGQAPAIIDVAPYFRPEAFAEAVVVVDAWLWYGEGPALAALLRPPDPPRFLARALLFRLVALNERAREEPGLLQERDLFARALDFLNVR